MPMLTTSVIRASAWIASTNAAICAKAACACACAARAASACEIADEISGYVAAVSVAADIASGLLQAKLWAGPQGIVCVAGSLYMIGDARQLLLK